MTEGRQKLRPDQSWPEEVQWWDLEDKERGKLYSKEGDEVVPDEGLRLPVYDHKGRRANMSFIVTYDDPRRRVLIPGDVSHGLVKQMFPALGEICEWRLFGDVMQPGMPRGFSASAEANLGYKIVLDRSGSSDFRGMVPCDIIVLNPMGDIIEFNQGARRCVSGGYLENGKSFRNVSDDELPDLKEKALELLLDLYDKSLDSKKAERIGLVGSPLQTGGVNIKGR